MNYLNIMFGKHPTEFTLYTVGLPSALQFEIFDPFFFNVIPLIKPSSVGQIDEQSHFDLKCKNIHFNHFN